MRRALGSEQPAAADAPEPAPAGTSPQDERILERVLPYTMTGAPRLQALVDSVRYCLARDIPGDFVECGVWRGGSVLAMILTLQEEGRTDRDIHLFDTFEGMTAPTEHDVSSLDPPALETWSAAQERDERPWSELFAGEQFNEEAVRETVLSTGYPPERIHFVRGPVEETLPANAPETIALLRLDTDWYESTRHELEHLYPRLSEAGVLIIDDYGHWDGARRAVDEYFEAHGRPPAAQPDRLHRTRRRQGLTARPVGVPRSVWALVAAGTLVRLALAFTTDGQPYDMEVLRELWPALDDAPLDVYATPIGPGEGIAWPYPPGFFVFAWLAGQLSDLTGLDYPALIRIPSILADAAIALVVARALGGSRGVAAAALVALGPSFIAISGYHGQLDDLAILPAVAAVAFWDRFPPPRRALYAGLLIGAGCAIKTTPVFVLLALLPSVRSWREAATMVTAAAAVPLAVMAPYLVHTPRELMDALEYRGFPGTSPLSILLQPELAEQLFRQVTPSRIVDALYDRGQAVVIVTLTAVAFATTRFGRGWTPAERATLLWLAFYIVTPVFFSQYLVWGLPFFLLAGRLRLVVAVQAVALLPTILFYRAPWEDHAVAYPYGASMIALWALFLAAFVLVVRERQAG